MSYMNQVRRRNSTICGSRGAVGCFLAAITMLTQAQIGGSAPIYAVGESWGYEVISPTGERSPFKETVATVTPTSIDVLTGKGGVRHFSPEMNPLDNSKTEIPLLSFPLEIGKKWEKKWDWASPDGNRIGSTSMTYKVVALEDIQVPAGRLQAYRIEANGWVKDKSTITSMGGDIKAAETYWYAPERKRIVKYEGKHLKWVSPRFVETWALAYELRWYRPAPQQVDEPVPSKTGTAMPIQSERPHPPNPGGKSD